MTAMQYALNLLFNGDADNARIYWDNFDNIYVPHVVYVQDGIETIVCIINGEVFFVDQHLVD